MRSPTLGSIVIGFAALAIVFTVLERLSPAIPGQRWYRRGVGTDLVYWVFSPLVAKPVERGAAILAGALTAVLLGAPLRKGGIEAFLAEPRGLGHLPPALQVAAALLLGDLAGYWSHRWFHGRRLWRFHAVHHAPKDLDWLSSVRVHPVNQIVTASIQAVVIVLSGVRPGALAAALPLFGLYALMLHANLPWTFGPLRHVLASPAFHRWHHTSEAEGLDRNFAGIFPWIDLIFGTFYMPPGKQPARFGVIGDEVPEGFLAQMGWPFRKK